jgi:hypothetical protein
MPVFDHPCAYDTIAKVTRIFFVIMDIAQDGESQYCQSTANGEYAGGLYKHICAVV